MPVLISPKPPTFPGDQAAALPISAPSFCKMSFESSHARWQAVTSRLRAADGHFVYAVKSTNIYCRPTCAARLARRANVDFYRTASDAEAGGYRPCKRCKPENAGLEEDGQGEIVQKACDVLANWAKDGAVAGDDGATSAGRKMGLKELAVEVGKTPRYLHKIFKDRMGVTPKQYAERMRELHHPTTASTMEGICTAASGTDTFIADFDPFDFNAFDLNFDFDPSLGLGDVGTEQSLVDVATPDLVADAVFSPGRTGSMPMTPNDQHAFSNFIAVPDTMFAHAQDLPALSPSALDSFLASTMAPEILAVQGEQDKADGADLSEWVWEAEWSNAVIDSYHRTAAIL